MTRLTPISLSDLQGHDPIALKQLDIDLDIITRLALSAECPADEDPAIFQEAIRDLRESVMSVRANMQGDSLAESVEELSQRIFVFMDCMKPGSYLETKLIT